MTNVRAPYGFALLYDDQPEYEEGGVAVRKGDGCDHLDFVAVSVGGPADFGPGDRVVLSGPDVGRRVMMDMVVYRLVKVGDVVGTVEE